MNPGAWRWRVMSAGLGAADMFAGIDIAAALSRMTLGGLDEKNVRLLMVEIERGAFAGANGGPDPMNDAASRGAPKRETVADDPFTSNDNPER
jgi:hypothetical protein